MRNLGWGRRISWTEAEDNEDRVGLHDCKVLCGSLASAAPASSSGAIPARLVQPIQLGGS